MAAEFEFTRFGLKFREIMFKKVKDFKFEKEDICLYHENINDIDTLDNLVENKYSRVDNRYTLHTNLEESEEDLLKRISKNYRYEIRRAQEKGLKLRYIVDQKHLKFQDFYNLLKTHIIICLLKKK